MCGRFASARKRQELLEEFGVQRDRVAEPLQPDYNVAPTKPVYAVVTRRPKDGADEHATGPDGPEAGRASEDRAAEHGKAEHGKAEHGKAEHGKAEQGSAEHGGVRELRVVRWGLVPSWAKDISIGSRLINARAETVASKPAFPPGVRPAPLPAPRGRLLRVGKIGGPEAPEAAALHPPRRRRRAGPGGPL